MRYNGGMTVTATAITSGSDVERLSGEYLATWADRDPARIAALHTPETRFELHGDDGPAVVGRAAVRTAFERIFAQWPAFTFETHRLLLGDGHWVLDWTLVASPAGKAVRTGLLDVVTVAPDGLVDRKDTYLAAGAPA